MDLIEGLECFIIDYCSALNTHCYGIVREFFIDKPVILYTGTDNITNHETLQAFMEQVWKQMPDETFSTFDREWIVKNWHSSTCTYQYLYEGHTIDGNEKHGFGRGTTTLIHHPDKGWKISHIHLSRLPKHIEEKLEAEYIAK